MTERENKGHIISIIIITNIKQLLGMSDGWRRTPGDAAAADADGKDAQAGQLW